MFIKVADLAADAEEYCRAAQIYEKVSRAAVENSALRWSVKDYLFKALLCHLAMAAPSHQMNGVQSTLDAYVDMCPHLDNTREKTLIEELIGDFAESDPDSFADHVFRFDKIMPLNQWTSKVLLQIKKVLVEGNPEETGVGV
jgi:alpha-soluble NSF attachment protein